MLVVYLLQNNCKLNGIYFHLKLVIGLLSYAAPHTIMIHILYHFFELSNNICIGG